MSFECLTISSWLYQVIPKHSMHEEGMSWGAPSFLSLGRRGTGCDRSLKG